MVRCQLWRQSRELLFVEVQRTYPAPGCAQGSALRQVGLQLESERAQEPAGLLAVAVLTASSLCVLFYQGRLLG